MFRTTRQIGTTHDPHRFDNWFVTIRTELYVRNISQDTTHFGFVIFYMVEFEVDILRNMIYATIRIGHFVFTE